MAAVAFAACTAGSLAAPPGVPTSALSKKAAQAIDAGRCPDPGKALYPFVVTWDATEQAEVAAHAQTSLVLVRVDGCDVQLLPGCQIPGEYRMRSTVDTEQALYVRNEDALYAQLPFGVAKLAAELEREGSLVVRYRVSGFRYGTAPALYRDQLAPGCAEATHFLLSYAVGAYEVRSGARVNVAAEGAVGPAAAGGRHTADGRVTFRGGDLSECDSHRQCDAPLRLRLLPVLDGSPPDNIAEAIGRALTKPGTESRAATSVSIAATMQSAEPGIRLCHEAQRGRIPGVADVRLEVRFKIGPDGVPHDVELVVPEGVDQDFVACARAVLHGARFPSGVGTTVGYVFFAGGRDDSAGARGPPEKSAAAALPPFDEAAVRRAAAPVLDAIRKECPRGGLDSTVVKFRPSGFAGRFSLQGREPSEETENCWSVRLRSIRVAPFAGEARNVYFEVYSTPDAPAPKR